MDFTMPLDDVKEQSDIFDAFPDELIKKMASEPLTYHAHDWVILKETYNKRKQL